MKKVTAAGARRDRDRKCDSGTGLSAMIGEGDKQAALCPGARRSAIGSRLGQMREMEVQDEERRQKLLYNARK